jgi:hypothetical protein
MTCEVVHSLQGRLACQRRPIAQAENAARFLKLSGQKWSPEASSKGSCSRVALWRRHCIGKPARHPPDFGTNWNQQRARHNHCVLVCEGISAPCADWRTNNDVVTRMATSSVTATMIAGTFTMA